jgi:hypothetical protein
MKPDNASFPGTSPSKKRVALLRQNVVGLLGKPIFPAIFPIEPLGWNPPVPFRA